MVLVIRGSVARLRRAVSFTCSAWMHGAILAWLALSPAPPTGARPGSIYDQEIKPNEKRIVWYHPTGRVPDIAPAEARRDARTKAPRARAIFDQSVVAGLKDDPRRRQMIYMPAPEIELPKPLPLPNVVTVANAPPRPLRAFTPPAPKPAPSVARALPDAPKVTPKIEPAALPFAVATPRPQPRAFTPPVVKPAPIVARALPDAPGVAALETSHAEPPPAILVPEKRPPPRSFTAPAASRTGAAPDPVLPAAPAASTPGRPEASLAIVGLEPSKAPDFPAPPGSRPADFSAGPQPRNEGGDSPSREAVIVVPGLMASGGGPEAARPTLLASLTPTQRNLLAGARAALPGATRVSSAPGSRLDGRVVYQLAIQMPNITSYSGSWMVWFAERLSIPGGPAADMVPPLALRKVDPKYIAVAAEERVEGIVRLFAVIRKDGRVDSVELLRHLDDRLDRSAEEALSKWEFRPALRNGSPVEVEAIFEVPFRLAPRPGK